MGEAIHPGRIDHAETISGQTETGRRHCQDYPGTDCVTSVLSLLVALGISSAQPVCCSIAWHKPWCIPCLGRQCPNVECSSPSGAGVRHCSHDASSELLPSTECCLVRFCLPGLSERTDKSSVWQSGRAWKRCTTCHSVRSQEEEIAMCGLVTLLGFDIREETYTTI